MEGDDVIARDEDAGGVDLWWFICTVCHRGVTSQARMQSHKWNVHKTRGVGNVLMLSQSIDLEPVVKISRFEPQDGNERQLTPETDDTVKNEYQDNDEEDNAVPICKEGSSADDGDDLPNSKVGRKPRPRKSQTSSRRKQIPETVLLEAVTGTLRPRRSQPKVPKDATIKKHITKRSAGNTSSTCKICSNTFPTVEKLRKHTLLVHAPNPALGMDESLTPVKHENGTESEDDTKEYDDGNDNDDVYASGSDSDWNDYQKPRNYRRTKAGAAASDSAASHPRQYDCPLCHEVFALKRDLSIHEDSTHNSKEDRTCNTCGRVYKNRNRLHRHVKELHEAEPNSHVCSTCGRGFTREWMLVSHAKCHEEQNCDICGKSVSGGLPQLEGHKLTHNPASFQCSLCGLILLILKTKISLKTHHIHKHTEDRPFKCQKCPLAFKLKEFLRRHVKSVHQDGGLQLPCEKCRMIFKSQTNLRNHTKNRHEAVHICRVCGQQFPGRVSLLRHELELHNYQRIETRYECVHCDKIFPSRVSYDNHVATHGNEKGFVCDSCGKAFKIGANLKQHLVTHLSYEEFKHACDVCGKRFPLPHHVRQHTKKYHQHHTDKTRAQPEPVKNGRE